MDSATSPLWKALDRRRRRELLTWEGLAQKLGVSRQMFWRWKQGQRPSAWAARILLRHYPDLEDVLVDALLTPVQNSGPTEPAA